MKIAHKKRKISGFDIGITIITLLIISIVLYPLIFIMSSSVSDQTMVATGKVFLLPKGFTLEGYKRVFQDSNIMTGYANSLFYAVVGTCMLDQYQGDIPVKIKIEGKAYTLDQKVRKCAGIEYELAGLLGEKCVVFFEK